MNESFNKLYHLCRSNDITYIRLYNYLKECNTIYPYFSNIINKEVDNWNILIWLCENDEMTCDMFELLIQNGVNIKNCNFGYNEQIAISSFESLYPYYLLSKLFTRKKINAQSFDIIEKYIDISKTLLGISGYKLLHIICNNTNITNKLFIKIL